MEMEPELVLNQTSSKFFVNMTRTTGFRNPKNHTGGFIKNKKELETGLKVPFKSRIRQYWYLKATVTWLTARKTVLSFFLSFLLCVIRDWHHLLELRWQGDPRSLEQLWSASSHLEDQHKNSNT
jgi:hypothetical protein